MKARLEVAVSKQRARCVGPSDLTQGHVMVLFLLKQAGFLYDGGDLCLLYIQLDYP
jgi:hypothetical protein